MIRPIQVATGSSFPTGMDDPSWADASVTRLVNARTGTIPVHSTDVRVIDSGSDLWVRFDCAATDIVATMSRYKDRVWTEGAVEVFLRPPGAAFLYEFQLSPIGTRRDLRVDDPGGPAQYCDDSWSAPGFSGTTVILRDVRGDVVGWHALIRIPWKDVAPGEHDVYRVGWESAYSVRSIAQKSSVGWCSEMGWTRTMPATSRHWCTKIPIDRTWRVRASNPGAPVRNDLEARVVEWREIGDRSSVPERVASEILRFIEAESLKPEDRLPAERSLAELLGVSRPSVREGVKFLEARGYLIVRRGQGVFLQRPPVYEGLRNGMDEKRLTFGHLFDMREVLEVPAAGWAAAIHDDAAIARIADALTELNARAADEPKDWALCGSSTQSSTCASCRPQTTRSSTRPSAF